MGKFERGEVRNAEQILTKLLNESKLSDEERKHKLFMHAKALERKIRENFPNIEKAVHVGDRYDVPGNIQLILKDEKVAYVEVKFVTGGTGTRANIDQDSLTDFLLFEENTISWSEFRRIHEHEKWVTELLEKFKDFPTSCQVKNKRESIERKASYLKENVLGVKEGNLAPVVRGVLSDPKAPDKKKLAANIIKEIMEKDREEKIRYIEYLSTRKQNPENIKRFVFLILAGAHSHKAFKSMSRLSLEQIVNALKDNFYNVYYINKKTLKVTSEDLTKKLTQLREKELHIFFRKNETNVIIGFQESGREEPIPILRIVFHWKNIFQGIKTPCLNIFDEIFIREF